MPDSAPDIGPDAADLPPAAARAAPIPHGERHARKAALIARLAAGEPVMAAAAAAGIGWRRAYVWRAEDAGFRAAWDRARAQAAARPIVAAYPVPASPPPAVEPALIVPPSPPRAGAAPRVFLITLPGHALTDYDRRAAQPGDKVVAVLWRDDGDPEVITHTVRADRMLERDDPPDLAAYAAVRPRLDALPHGEDEAPAFIFAGPQGSTLRTPGAEAQAGDRILRLIGLSHDRAGGWKVTILEPDGRERDSDRDPALYEAAMAAMGARGGA